MTGVGTPSLPALAIPSTQLQPAWTTEEHKLLEAAMKQFPPERYSHLERCLRISIALPRKTARDVAYRLRWLAKKGGKKPRTRVPGLPPSSSVSAAITQPTASAQGSRMQTGGQQGVGGMMSGTPMAPLQSVPGGAYTMGSQPQTAVPPPMASCMDEHGASAVGVGGAISQLLDSNYVLLNQFKVNMQQCRVHDNIDLLVRFRDNILAILSQMNSMGGVMAQMPPLPVRLNVDLADNFLPKAGTTMFPSVPMLHPSYGTMNGWQPAMMPGPAGMPTTHMSVGMNARPLGAQPALLHMQGQPQQQQQQQQHMPSGDTAGQQHQQQPDGLMSNGNHGMSDGGRDPQGHGSGDALGGHRTLHKLVMEPE